MRVRPEDVDRFETTILKIEQRMAEHKLPFNVQILSDIDLENLSRRQFNKYINLLNKIDNSDAFDIVLRNERSVTKWEATVSDYAIKDINRHRQQEKETLKVDSPYTGMLLRPNEIKLRENRIDAVGDRYRADYLSGLIKSGLISDSNTKARIYKDNFVQAIQNVFGSGTEVEAKVKKMSASELLYSFYYDPYVSIQWIYDEQQHKKVRMEELSKRLDETIINSKLEK